MISEHICDLRQSTERIVTEYHHVVSSDNNHLVLEIAGEGDWAELDEEARAFRERLLTGKYPYLLPDAVYEKVRIHPTVET